MLSALRSPRPPPVGALAGALVNALAAVPGGLVLVLDDYHVVEAAAVHGLLAYLIDRLLVAEGKPQRYGTQFHVVDGKLVPHPIEDEASVDLLRAFAGLPSLAEYKKAMQQK